jgi:hypothetical protein
MEEQKSMESLGLESSRSFSFICLTAAIPEPAAINDIPGWRFYTANPSRSEANQYF